VHVNVGSEVLSADIYVIIFNVAYEGTEVEQCEELKPGGRQTVMVVNSISQTPCL